MSVHDAGTMLLKHNGKVHEARESLDSGIRRDVVQLLAPPAKIEYGYWQVQTNTLSVTTAPELSFGAGIPPIKPPEPSPLSWK